MVGQVSQPNQKHICLEMIQENWKHTRVTNFSFWKWQLNEPLGLVDAYFLENVTNLTSLRANDRKKKHLSHKTKLYLHRNTAIYVDLVFWTCACLQCPTFPWYDCVAALAIMIHSLQGDILSCVMFALFVSLFVVSSSDHDFSYYWTQFKASRAKCGWKTCLSMTAQTSLPAGTGIFG